MTPQHPRLREITSHRDLLELTDGDPFVRWAVADPLPGAVLAAPRALGVLRHGKRGRGMWIIPHTGGGAVGVRDLLEALGSGPLASLGCTHLSVPQEFADVLATTFDIGPGGDWDWMWTTQRPARYPGEDDLLELDDSQDATEIQEFSHTHNPRVWTEVGTGRVQHWLGVRDRHGELVAVGGAEREPSGVPHLAGILTHPAHRGRGMAGAISAALTRRAIDDYGVCTLGMFSDNDGARALYGRLGYRTAHAWCSRQLVSSTATRS